MIEVNVQNRTLWITVTGAPLVDDLLAITNEQEKLISSNSISALEIHIHASSALGVHFYDCLNSLCSYSDVSDITLRTSSSTSLFREIYYTDFFYDHIYRNRLSKNITWFNDNEIISGKAGYKRALSLVRKNSIYCSRNKNEIFLGKYYRDLGWQNQFTQVVRAVDTTKPITVSFAKCTWGDPHPLLALIIQIRKWEMAGCRLNLIFPDKAERPFIVYLVQEGFLFQLIKNAKSNSNISISTTVANKKFNYPEYTKRIAKSKDQLIFARQTCIPAQILSTEYETDVLVDKLIKEAKQRGLEKALVSDSNIPYTSNAQFITQELRQALIELVQNVKQHAYPKQSEGYIGLYARLRYGTDERNTPNLDKLSKGFRFEKRYCPAYKTGPVEKYGFIEVYVSDAGVGFETTLKEQDWPVYDGKKHIFGQYVRDLVRGSSPLIPREGQPTVRGLESVVTMLRRRKGFVRILDAHTWYGENIGALKSPPHPTSISMAVEPPQGSHITLRISKWKNIELESDWTVENIDNYKDRSDDLILHSYTTHNIEEVEEQPLINILCVDDLAQAMLDWERPIENFTVGSDEACHTVMFRPRRNTERKQILTRAAEICEHTTHTTLIIADQDLSHSLMTVSVFLNTNRQTIPTVDRIIILSSNYCHAEMIPGKDGYFIVNSKRENHLRGTGGVNFSHIIHALKRIDSQLFYRGLKDKNEISRVIKPGPVYWGYIGGNTALDNFIDFNATLNNKICRWIYKRSLSRFISYVSTKKRPWAADHYVGKLINDFYFYNNDTIREETDSDHDSYVVIGSVSVSQQSIRNICNSIHRSPGDKVYPCAYIHSGKQIESQSTGHELYYLLRWSPKLQAHISREKLAQKPNLSANNSTEYCYRRIVDSPAIGPLGNKEWYLVRCIDAQGETNKDDRRYIYGNSPANANGVGPDEAYAYWQSHDYLRFGHWESGGHHDCIGINLLDALRLDSLADPEGDSWKYVSSHASRVYLPSEYEESQFPECDMLVCTSGEISLFVLDKIFSKYRDCESNTGISFEERTAVLSTIQKRRSATRLRINPLDLEELSQKIDVLFHKLKRKVTVLLFDPVISSIRSFLEMRDAIRSVDLDKVGTVFSFSLLDRSRMPNNEDLLLDSTQRHWHIKHSRLWRLDIDALSPASGGAHRSDGCPFCDSMTAIEKLLSVHQNEVTRQRLTEWIKILGPKRINGLSMSHTSGVSELNLFDRGIEVFVSKPVGQNRSDYSCSIRLSKSSGLATLFSELVTISGDYTLIDPRLDKIDKELIQADDITHDRLVGAKIEALVAQLVHFRWDMEDSRRKHLYKRLITALHESKSPTRATCFGCSLLMLVGSKFAADMVQYVATNLYRDDNESTNVDYHIALSILAKIGGGEKLLRLISSDNIRSYFRSLLSLTESNNETYISHVKTIFEVIGYRIGARHHTLLYRQLDDQKKHSNELTTTIHALFDQVLMGFAALKRLSSALPSTCSHEWIEMVTQRIELLVKQGKADKCHSYLYTEKPSHFDELKRAFCFNSYMFQKLQEKLFSDQIDRLKFFCSPDTDYQAIDNLFAITSNHLEELVFELITNAFKYYREMGKDDSLVYVKFGVGTNSLCKTRTATITVSNEYYGPAPNSKSYSGTIHHSIFLSHGGTYEHPEDQNRTEYVVKLSLPVLNTLQKMEA